MLEAWPDASLLRYKDVSECLRLIRNALTTKHTQAVETELRTLLIRNLRGTLP